MTSKILRGTCAYAQNVEDDGTERSQLAVTVAVLRERKGFKSHEALSKAITRKTGLTVAAKTIGNIEADRHSTTAAKLEAIAATLGVELWQLYLPPCDAPDVIRDVLGELFKRPETDQREILGWIRKLQISEPRPKLVSVPTKIAK